MRSLDRRRSCLSLRGIGDGEVGSSWVVCVCAGEELSRQPSLAPSLVLPQIQITIHGIMENKVHCKRLNLRSRNAGIEDATAILVVDVDAGG
ncbi:hypothetical protein HYFRA_00008046 [Hymenoscyphus fraxineus]|uniref:Uncharacterized protein n=1 Tax=Hymenoscyphus fraxineus TaxID=746836 RepID=A0A9N9KQ30_9HELO|nr:hypothetical protein HYFRA_00008046 [Hymenoscyphus fraxineus]